MSEVRVKRAYDPPAVDDGFRVLVDRLWPRGLTRDAAKIDLWLKDAAPSASLRRWFGHDPTKWREFQDRYRAELVGNAALNKLLALVEGGRRVTLLFGAKDTLHNNALVLKAICERGPRDAR
ncbi:DUF488 domain-containing protein [Roseomonas mucosa]|jgi:uncharacterized protein YeaO (DUF488 family)|uniref:DUF488 domain-containing protein n=1 Tax=Roseomonas mucosa TaxID=207340 RepID=UPI00384C534A